MMSFFGALIILIVGYFTYGRWVDNHFGMDPNRPTPAITQQDGVDFVPLPWHKIFLIQFLNIAGLGPIFGAIMGALYGPVAFLWIAFGCVLGGAVHDYFSGMLSIRHEGKSIPEIVGHYLGENTRKLMRGFSVILLVLVVPGGALKSPQLSLLRVRLHPYPHQTHPRNIPIASHQLPCLCSSNACVFC